MSADLLQYQEVGIEQIDSWAWGKERQCSRVDMYLIVLNFDAEERGSNELELPHEVQNNPPIRPNCSYHCWRLVLNLPGLLAYYRLDHQRSV